ncbi:hypothetical protein AEW27_15940 [Salmonella enterica subsp. enterica serovar Montevideo]|uniref:RES domain-containing protein n=1 Tax=Salmonella montevideo TaxID=115981 RepID=A0A624ZBZ1_SALMO|nr:hypothetical protein [Salmonella enterica]EBV5798375.1 hypothetical protein [Salmonella enterica subsp. enterica serovar Anatum]EDS3927046.1 hypothetical protein [Salmonella enterica subsp. enterica]EDV8188267.1 hypothetical protein [Salmonella enterica subsp. enterica serovar Mbandaka]EGE5068215.1 hypothetical protein [Salmonella enterica subsp. enterica serovar Anatum str. CFSAN003973]EGE5082621.1 hypothetical protein [Salmonella enterica subsp. enterica serovar Anatum str. CFSAN003962]E
MITENNINIELEKLFDNILRKSSIRPPIEVGKNNDLISDFHSKCEKFKDCLKEYLTNNDKILAHRVRSRLKVIQSLQDGIINCLECFLTGDIKSAYDCFELMLKPQFISRHIKNICIPLTEMCNSQRPLFRVRKSDRPLSTRKDIFHIPFNQRHLVRAQRYSVAGLPCLYLGTSLYICWREMDKPDFDKLYISSFITDKEDDKSLLLNLSADFLYKTRLFLKRKNAPKPIEKYSTSTMLSYLALWPLILACNYLKKHNDASFIQEYIIPNLLMQWISRDINNNIIIGIAYRSTKLPANTDSRKGINVVLPPKARYEDIKGYDFCPVLSDKFKFTPPVSWQVLKTLEYVPLRQSFSDRENLSEELRRKKSWEIMGNIDDEILSIYKLSDFYKLEVCMDEILVYDEIFGG